MTDAVGLLNKAAEPYGYVITKVETVDRGFIRFIGGHPAHPTLTCYGKFKPNEHEQSDFSKVMEIFHDAYTIAIGKRT